MSQKVQERSVLVREKPLAEVKPGLHSDTCHVEEPALDVSIKDSLEETVEYEEKSPAVVVVRGACKAYHGGAQVLSDYSMTVERGKIYALLGSSGCGKTTILSCISGVRRLDSGSIHVFGNRPGERGSDVPGKNLGYMPQDISLYGDFTIGETLSYFGSLLCVSKIDLDRNKKRLFNVLTLPDQKTYVGALSDGQRRRVSIAVAMINDPPLLILDEPTVGVDPVYRESLWEYLLECVSKRNTTVLITTQYIDEAKQAHSIGLMRNGKLLAEKSPGALLREHNTTSLKDVFLRLCETDSEDLQDKTMSLGEQSKEKLLESAVIDTPISEIQPVMATIEGSKGSTIGQTMKRIFTLGRKNGKLLLRNYILLIFILCVPAAQVLIMCLALGGEPKTLKVGVVNHEFEFSNVENCHDLLELRKNEECSLIGWSCEYLKLIPDDVVHQIFYKNEEEARLAVQQGKTWGFMSFPEEFSNSYYTKVAASTFLDEETMNGSTINLEMDETNIVIAGTLKLNLGLAFLDFTKEMLVECGFSELMARIPLRFAEPVYGTESDMDAREFMASGLLISILFFFPLLTSAIQFIYEKKQGIMERTLSTGVNTWEIMTSFSLIIAILLLVQTAFALTVVTFLFNIKVHGSFGLCIALGILVGIAGTSMGFLIGSLCKEEVEGVLVSIALFFPVVMLSGILSPLESMTKALRYFSYALPCQLPAEAMRSIVSRGWGFLHPHVWHGFASITGWIMLYWLITILLHKKHWTR